MANQNSWLARIPLGFGHVQRGGRREGLSALVDRVGLIADEQLRTGSGGRGRQAGWGCPAGDDHADGDVPAFDDRDAADVDVPDARSGDVTLRPIPRTPFRAATGIPVRLSGRSPEPDGHAVHWLNWRRRHQARARWFHQCTPQNREYSLVS